MATYTAKLEICSYDSTVTAGAGTDETSIEITAHTMDAGDFIVNETRRTIDAERGSRVVYDAVTGGPNFILLNPDQGIVGQTSGDSIRLYKFEDKTSIVRPKTLRLDLGTQGFSSLSFDIITDKDYIPKCGQYIKFGITTDSTYKRYFYGIIQDTTRRLMAENTDEIIMNIRATSLNTVPNRRTIEVAFDAGTTFQEIVETMVDEYLVGDGISQGTIDEGETLDNDWYDDIISISDVLDRCARESGYQWFIDEEGDLNFYQDPSTIPTNSIVIDEGDLGTFGDIRQIRVNENIDQYLNKYFISGGYDERGNPILLGSEDFDESTAQQDITAGTGVYGEILRDSGIIGSDYVTAESGTTTTNITYTAHGQSVGDIVWNLTQNIYRAVATVVDADNFTVSAITGQSDGDIIVFFDKANIIFENIFKSQGRIPLKVDFASDTLSFNAGEKIRIKLPSLGITDDYFLIQKVSLFDYVGLNATTTQGFRMNVSCVVRDNSNFSTQRLKDYRDYWGDF